MGSIARIEDSDLTSAWTLAQTEYGLGKNGTAART